jgi:phospholipid/cholesterol/gamma-HCH transport system substrate-binding protein
MERDVGRDVKVGIFVFFAIFLLGMAVWVLGQGTEAFEDRYKVNASYDDVVGLRDGAVVRLAGIDIGEVSQVRMSDDAGVKPVFVELTIKAQFQNRIREDSVARIETEGLLGDKYVAISVGSQDKPELKDGAWITVKEPKQLIEYETQANEVLTELQQIAAKVNTAIGTDDETDAVSLAAAVSGVERIIDEAENGNGLIHALVYDDKLPRKLDRIATNLETGTDDLAHITTEVRTNDSIANELLLGEGGEELATQIKDVAGGLEELIKDIESEDSVVHALLYDADKAQLVDDLTVTAANLRAVSDGLEEGDGTAGLLLQDPELYEDLRALVGGAERNKLLRFYIRRSMLQSEAEQAMPFSEIEDESPESTDTPESSETSD